MRRYFVVEPEQVVADDLAHAIRTADPGAVVETFQTVAEIWTPLRLARPRALILSLDPQGFADTPPGRELAAEGIPFAFLCTWGSDRAGDAIILASPFSEATVSALLEELTGPRD